MGMLPVMATTRGHPTMAAETSQIKQKYPNRNSVSEKRLNSWMFYHFQAPYFGGLRD